MVIEPPCTSSIAAASSNILMSAMLLSMLLGVLLIMSQGIEVVRWRRHCADNVSTLSPQAGSGCAVFSTMKHLTANTKIKKRKKDHLGKKVRNE